MRLLVLEDKNEIVDAITLSLLIEWPDIDIMATSTFADARTYLATEKPDIILLESNLPGSDIVDNLALLRTITSVPVIILTDTSDENEVLRSLDQGANDFVTRPFTRVELVTRIKQQLYQKHDRQTAAGLEFGMLRYDATKGQFICNGQILDLTPTERDILYYLVKEAGRVLRHSELVKLVWGTEQPNPAKTLKVHIHHLRDKIIGTCTHAKDNHVIQTWPNLGYSIGVPE